MNNIPPTPQTSTQFLVATLNARLQPTHRGEFFEDPLDAALKASGRCEVSGGGTMGGPSGEIQYCDIEVSGAEIGPQDIALIVSTLDALGAPKGSKLKIEASGQKSNLATRKGWPFT